MKSIQLIIIVLMSILVGAGSFINVGALWFVLGFGVLGATLEKEANWSNVIHGFLMAGMIYLLFVGQMLSGDAGGGMLTSNLFPSFTQTNEASVKAFLGMRPCTVQDAAKLFVWAFIAGYNKKWTQGLLDRIRGTVNS